MTKGKKEEKKKKRKKTKKNKIPKFVFCGRPQGSPLQRRSPVGGEPTPLFVFCEFLDCLCLLVKNKIYKI